LYGAGCGQQGKPPLCPQGVFPIAWKKLVDHVRNISSSTMMLPGPDGCENPKEGGIGVYPPPPAQRNGYFIQGHWPP
jgi:hypothetical protein